MTDVLDSFSAPTRRWFAESFGTPTAAQTGAWAAIARGDHVQVVAPTGSGKTLAAFLWAIDKLSAEPTPPDRTMRCRVLYVSPLKALAVDVERNLRSPLVGIGHAASRLGMPVPSVSVTVRSGDTPTADRRSFLKSPTDILITTPESLFLMLTSQAREVLRGIETVIIDEVHAVAGTKRGAHLAVTLDRLDALLPAPAQRIGLSATVRPVEEVARFLGGGRPVTIVQPPATKRWNLQVVIPVPDLTELDAQASADDGPANASIWPFVESRIVDLVAHHKATLVFCNSRRLAERLTARLNEIWVARGGTQDIARAHHGSVSRDQRLLIEEDLKAGRLPAVVATSSLELGIDMGDVDLVIQVESPPSVASGLQRIGRAGHQVGATSHGILLPKYRGDLVQCAVVAERMRAGAIESLHVPTNPLDVLAQQIVAMCALDDWSVADLAALVRRSAPFASLTMPVLESVLDMLTGRYPSDEFAELRPRLVWDRIAGTLSGRRGAQRLAVTSGGTIPDRGLYAVFLAGGEGPGRRVGELDEEMVYESRVGDVFTLGTSTWRIEDITHDRVLVSPAPGQPGRLPFWKGDSIGRPAELGAALGAFVRDLATAPDDLVRVRLAEDGLDPWAADNLLAYLAEQRQATGRVPNDRTVVVERFRDEIGDWRIVIHSPYGAPVHQPWSLALASRLRERFGVDARAMAGDDGIVVTLPDVEAEDLPERDLAAAIAELIYLDPSEIDEIVTANLGGSALFASRFRECAARALLLPRRHPGKRQALWQQRMRSAQLLEVASGFPTFPIVLEAVRECLQDVFDVPGLKDLMARIDRRDVHVVHVETATPSPFAKSLLFGYVAQYLYEGDSPLAERRAAALSLDPALLADLLGHGESLALRDLLDPAAIAQTEAELQHLAQERMARDAEDVVDLLRVLGPLSGPEIRARVRPQIRSDELEAWLGSLVGGQLLLTRIAGQEQYAVAEDAGKLRDALGAALPLGLPEAFLTPVADPLGDLVARFARTRGPFRLDDVAARFGLGVQVARDVVRRLIQGGRLVEGELIPLGRSDGGLDLCDPGVLRTIRRRSIAALRAEVEPVEPRQFARFLPSWQGVTAPPRWRGSEGLLRAVEQLSALPLPASAIESLVLPARVTAYSPALLDELTNTGDVVWCGHHPIGADDGWVSLHTAALAPLTLPLPDESVDLADTHRRILEALEPGGAWFFRQLASALGDIPDGQILAALWDLVWASRVTNDTLAPVRGLLAGGRGAHRSAARPPHRARYVGRSAGLAGRPVSTAPPSPPTAQGRWTLLPRPETDPTIRALGAVDGLLDRYGVVTRGSVVAEAIPGGFAAAYRILATAEESGKVRRGYFVESLGAAQFATTGAIDQLRAGQPTSVAVLAAADSANPFGAALPWPPRVTGDPERSGHQPGRKAGALVVISDGELVLYVERGGRTLLSFTEDPEVLRLGADALAGAVRAGALGRLTVERADGATVLGSEHPLVAALESAGFRATPKGLRLRR